MTEHASPTTKSLMNIPSAFFIGGVICTLGEFLLNLFERYGYSLHEFRNENRDKTRFHVSILDKYGVHGEARSKIVKADRLDAGNMHWAAQRYWLAQDTVVDTEALVEMIAKIVPRKTGDREEL